MATTTHQPLRYTLAEIGEIIFNGFDYEIPESILKQISVLSKQVGSPDYVKTPIFKKREINIVNNEFTQQHQSNTHNNPPKKNKKNREASADDDDWNNNFQTTKIKSNIGIKADFDNIRSFINKITDKNYDDMRNKIINTIEKMVSENTDLDYLCEIGINIFDIASSNRYFSKIYAELYSDLSSKFDFIKNNYKENLHRFTELFNNIEYVNPNDNYDKFCEINKINEKRKSLASFYVNLMNCGIIPKMDIILITRNFLALIVEFMLLENKKNEVDELTETIVILYNKKLYHNELYDKINGPDNCNYDINELVEKLAKSKVKDYKSLTNKSLFKFMDLIE